MDHTKAAAQMATHDRFAILWASRFVAPIGPPKRARHGFAGLAFFQALVILSL